MDISGYCREPVRALQVLALQPFPPADYRKTQNPGKGTAYETVPSTSHKHRLLGKQQDSGSQVRYPEIPGYLKKRAIISLGGKFFFQGKP